MAEYFGFYNQVNNDRQYQDSALARALSLLSGGNGIVPDYLGELAPSTGTSLQTVIASGAAWIGNPGGWWYVSDEDQTITHDAESVGYTRIDRIVIRSDRSTDKRIGEVILKNGTPTTGTPAAPLITQNATLWEEAICQVLIRKVNSVDIATITDERIGAPSAANSPGDVKITARSETNIPLGWLLCQGQTVSRTQYARLFAAIGTVYGAGNGTTTFQLPDLRNASPVGASGTKALGSKGGSETHKHLETIGIDSSSGTAYMYINENANGSEAISGWRRVMNLEAATNTAGRYAYTASANSYSPYVALNFIIKY